MLVLLHDIHYIMCYKMFNYIVKVGFEEYMYLGNSINMYLKNKA